jgi:predicted nucleic acid-binding protein
MTTRARQVVIDASAVLAVLLAEPQREALIASTQGVDLLAPGSVPWEVGNALAAGLKRRRLSLPEAREAWASFERISWRQCEVDVSRALEFAAERRIYAYDAYLLEAAGRFRLPLLTLDAGLARSARTLGVPLWEI